VVFVILIHRFPHRHPVQRGGRPEPGMSFRCSFPVTIRLALSFLWPTSIPGDSAVTAATGGPIRGQKRTDRSRDQSDRLTCATNLHNRQTDRQTHHFGSFAVAAKALMQVTMRQLVQHTCASLQRLPIPSNLPTSPLGLSATQTQAIRCRERQASPTSQILTSQKKKQKTREPRPENETKTNQMFWAVLLAFPVPSSVPQSFVGCTVKSSVCAADNQSRCSTAHKMTADAQLEGSTLTRTGHLTTQQTAWCPVPVLPTRDPRRECDELQQSAVM